MIDIIIADDHRLVAEGIARLIDDNEDIRVVAIAGSIGQTKELIDKHHPKVLLLDIAMPDGDGIDAIQLLTAATPSPRIVILTVFAEPNVIHRAMESGAHGYILKNTDKEELIAGIKTVAQGQSYLCQEAQQLLGSIGKTPTKLTTREREILRLIVQGYSMKEIADILHLGFETVHSYTKYLRQKLGCSNIAALVRTAIEQHL